MEDHELLARTLNNVLLTEFSGCVLWNVRTGEEAIQKARDHGPNVVIMDVSLPGMSGIEATRQIRRDVPAAHIIVWTTHGDPRLRSSALEAGAHAFLDKASGSEELTRTVRAMLQGEAV